MGCVAMKNKAEAVKLISKAVSNYGLIQALHSIWGSNIKVKLGFSSADISGDIDNLNLSVRSYNALKRASISTIENLIDKLNNGDIRTIRNLGVKSFREIQTKLLIYGFERLSENEKQKFYSQLVADNFSIVTKEGLS